MTNKEIRRYLGHNGAECRVKIKRNGMILRHGSDDPFDRSQDYWTFMGWAEDYRDPRTMAAKGL